MKRLEALAFTAEKAVEKTWRPTTLRTSSFTAEKAVEKVPFL